jgi:uncharacterized protein (DUF1501 family)
MLKLKILAALAGASLLLSSAANAQVSFNRDKDPLVVFGGGFGRTPMSQGGDGRDHHIKGFSFMMADAGIKGGLAYGATDELGYAAVENPVSVHDFHATMLYLLGIDHKRLTVRYQGQDARLTFVFGNVVKDIIV